MTIMHQPVRAVARVTRAAPAAGPAILLPVRRPDHLGPVHLIQLLVVEAAITIVVASLTRGLLVVVATAAGGALLLVALGRRQRRWWLEQVVMTWHYQRRRRTRPGRHPDDRRLAALRLLAPGLTVQDVAVADGSQVGIARDDAGWFAAAAVSRDTTMPDDPGGRLPLDTLAAALADAGQPGAVLQLVRRTVPAPSIDVHPAAPASQSYRQLLAGFGAAPVPMDRATWIAVRLDARSLAATGVTSADLATAPDVVAGLIRSVTKSLRRAGVSSQVLDAAGLVGALARSCDLEPPASNRGSAGPREEWTRWHSTRLAHRSFWIRRWPPVEQAPALLDWLAAAPATATNVALTLSPGEGELVDLRGLVRVTAPPGELDQLCEAVTSGAGQAQAGLFPLDGEQGPAAYASAPTGGGPR